VKAMHEVRIALWAEGTGSLAAVENSLLQLGCHVERVGAFEDLWRLVESDLDLVVVNCQNAADLLYWMNGIRRAGQSTPPVLTLAAELDVEKYLKAMNLGAYDCVALPVQERELYRLVRRALEERHAEPLLLPTL